MALVISSCAQTPQYILICADVQEYTKEEQSKAKAEYDKLKSLGQFPTLVKFVDDYGALRIVLRACKGANDGTGSAIQTKE